MRLCRFRNRDQVAVGFYAREGIVPLQSAREAFCAVVGEPIDVPQSADLLDFLPPDGTGFGAARKLAVWVAQEGSKRASLQPIPLSETQLLVPLPRPNKLLLLAGNYARHIEEGGGKAAERAETFPYVFMKPPTTTLTDPGRPVTIPRISPAAIDWELELAVVIGRRCKGVSEAEALRYVAGYTIVNDISNRRFKPNPHRKQRDRDGFFDWLHGKWHDSFCPCGPCVVTPDVIPDPQGLAMKLKVNGELKQDASTAQMIFPVAAVIEFIASFVTLEPGDIISTGTPHGVGSAKGTFLKPGDRIEATIDQIGQLDTLVVAEE
jgi:2-keto-4-pentenoate hydratase/2-oxohepta-3-ene-1,7-dioic acid hydratase in catechol pathway